MQQRFTDNHFRLFSNFMKENYGVHYAKEKAGMLQAKLEKLMAKNSITSYEQYYDFITQVGSAERLAQCIDELTTHTTDFFRENSHFEYISGNIKNIVKLNSSIYAGGEIRVWSAACSTGEEAYTLAMVLSESLPENIKIKILATDISTKVVASAMRGVYTSGIEQDMNEYYLKKYFTQVGKIYEVNQPLKDRVTFRQFNLMEPFPFKKTFDMIFCRNVMIYFDRQVQARLVNKMYDVLGRGGLFFIGHSEGLVNKEHKFRYIQPTLYMKE